MSEYTAEDGLRVLAYLGLQNTETENSLFKIYWDKAYARQKGTCERNKKEMNEGVIFTTLDLYSGATVHENPSVELDQAENISQERRREFIARASVTCLLVDMQAGVSLEEILKAGPHKFLTGAA